MSKNNALIIFLAAIYSCTVGSGLVGYGIDVNESYSSPNIDLSIIQLYDRFGWFVAKSEVYGIYFGAKIVSFFVMYTLLTYYLFLNREINRKESTTFQVFLLFCATSFSWVVILPSVNVLRQGLLTSAILALIVFSHYSHKTYATKVVPIFINITLCLIIIASHNFGRFFLPLLIVSLFVVYLIKRKKNEIAIIALLATVTFLFVTLPILMTVDNMAIDQNIDHGGNYALYFFIIGLLFPLSIIVNGKATIEYVLIVVATCAIFFIYLDGQSWQYQRVWMILVPFLIADISRRFPPPLFFEVSYCIIFVVDNNHI